MGNNVISTKTQPSSFVLKKDFNFTGFKIASKAKYLLSAKNTESNELTQINRAIAATIDGEAVTSLINAGHTVIIYYSDENKIDCYNFESELDLITLVSNC